jgi:hypothetical protein
MQLAPEAKGLLAVAACSWWGRKWRQKEQTAYENRNRLWLCCPFMNVQFQTYNENYPDYTHSFHSQSSTSYANNFKNTGFDLPRCMHYNEQSFLVFTFHFPNRQQKPRDIKTTAPNEMAAGTKI